MSDQAVTAVLDALERTKTPYMIVGSRSCNVYTIPRSTKDADIVVKLSETGDALMRELHKIFRVDPLMSFETVTGSTRYVLAAETGFKIELFLLRDDPYDQSRFARRRQVNAERRDVWVASAEDVVSTSCAGRNRASAARTEMTPAT
jgi:hypothetical protein